MPAIAEPVNKPPRSGSPDAAKFDYIASTIRKSLGVNTIDRMSPQIYLRTTMTEQKPYNVGPSHIDIAYERFGDPAAPPVLPIMGGGRRDRRAVLRPRPRSARHAAPVRCGAGLG